MVMRVGKGLHSGIVRLKKSKITISLPPANDLMTPNEIHGGLKKEAAF